jgi:hypothetical protein
MERWPKGAEAATVEVEDEADEEAEFEGLGPERCS